MIKRNRITIQPLVVNENSNSMQACHFPLIIYFLIAMKVSIFEEISDILKY